MVTNSRLVGFKLMKFYWIQETQAMCGQFWLSEKYFKNYINLDKTLLFVKASETAK